MALKTLFLDVGGVLLTDGWDHAARCRAAESFGLDYAGLEERHSLTFDTYELGKISLDTYLDRVIFHEPRPFFREQFRQYMFEQSQPYPEVIDLARLISRDGLRIGVISNEGRELATYRTNRFGLAEFVDTFIYSSFVHLRKPDEDIFLMALDVAQTPAEQAIYVDDRAMFADVAGSLGMHAIHHTGYESTLAALKRMGLGGP